MAPEAIHLVRSTRGSPYAARVPAVRLALLALGLSLLVVAPANAAITRDQAVRIAIAEPSVAKTMAKYSPVEATARLDGDTYIVQFGSANEVRAEVDVDGPSGKVVKVYIGTKATFPLARGRSSGFADRTINAAWVWLPLALIFVGAFFDRRRPWRLLHLDLLAIVALGISF